MDLLSNIAHYTEGNYNLLFKKNLPQHVKEQVILRELLCTPCLTRGSCDKCGCKTPNMFYASTKVDSRGRWASFLDEKQ